MLSHYKRAQCWGWEIFHHQSPHWAESGCEGTGLAIWAMWTHDGHVTGMRYRCHESPDTFGHFLRLFCTFRLLQRRKRRMLDLDLPDGWRGTESVDSGNLSQRQAFTFHASNDSHDSYDSNDSNVDVSGTQSSNSWMHLASFRWALAGGSPRTAWFSWIMPNLPFGFHQNPQEQQMLLCMCRIFGEKACYLDDDHSHDDTDIDCTSSTRTRRGGSWIYYKTFLIYRTCMRRAPARPVRACFVRSCCADVVQEHDLRATPVQGNAKRRLSAHFTLHSSHFTLHTCTSHSTLHLISKHVSSSHHISALLISSHLFSHVIKVSSTVFTSSEHWSAFLISSKLFSTHLSCSVRQKALTVREMSLA